MSSDPENDKNAVLRAQHDPDGQLARENADLRAKLAALQSANVLRGAFAGEAPKYLLNEAGFYDDTHFPAGSVLEFLDTPNLSMAPLNEPARRALEAYIAGQEEGARRVAALRGRDFFGLVSDRNVLIDLARQDATADAAAPVPVIQMPEPHGQVPAMPHIPTAAAKRGPGRPRTVLRAEGPAPIKPVQNPGEPVAAPYDSRTTVVGRMVS